MGYTDEQKRQHTAELQQYLYTISYFDKRIPQILPDGFYGENTENAVRIFQKEYGLPETGEADYQTWDKIVNVYRKYLSSKPEPIKVFPSEKYVCREGESGRTVYIIQALLNELGRCYDNMPELAVSGEYGAETAEAVMEFQKKTGLPQTGEVNGETWNMLIKCT